MNIITAIARLEIMKIREPNEPVFILRGRDVLAGQTVGAWIRAAEGAGVNRPKIMEAQQAMSDLLAYEPKKIPD